MVKTNEAISANWIVFLQKKKTFVLFLSNSFPENLHFGPFAV